MMNDNFPSLGKVAIIDDKYAEIDKLARFLSKHSIPYVYYDGDIDNFPSEEDKKPIQLIFMDLLINGSNSLKNLVSTLISNINALISDYNGPYTLIIWSQNYEKNEKGINEAIEKLTNRPENWFYLSKADLIDSKKFGEKLTECMSLSFKRNSLVNLSNVCLDHFQYSLAKSFYLFNNSILSEVDGDKKISVLLNYVLNDEYSSIRNLPKSELISLFLPSFEQLIACYSINFCRSKALGISPNLINKNVGNKLDESTYNGIVHICRHFNYREPRTVYKTTNKKLLDEIMQKYVGAREDEIKTIEIDITHLCTVAYDKSIYRTMVSGFLLNCKSKICEQICNKTSDYICYVGSFCYEKNEEFCFFVLPNKIITKKNNNLFRKNAIFAVSNKWYRKIRFAVSYLLGKIN